MIVYEFAPGYVPKLVPWTSEELETLHDFKRQDPKKKTAAMWQALQEDKFSGYNGTTKRSARAIQEMYVSCSPSPPRFNSCEQSLVMRAHAALSQRATPISGNLDGLQHLNYWPPLFTRDVWTSVACLAHWAVRAIHEAGPRLTCGCRPLGVRQV